MGSVSEEMHAMATHTPEALSGDYTIDPARSRLGFVARHAMVTKVRGQFHDYEGTVHVDFIRPEKSSAQVTIDAASIDTRNEQRDGQLRTNDFLDVPHHPQITFSSTRVRRTREGFRVDGDLAIKGVTRPIRVDFDYTGAAGDRFGNLRLGFAGAVTVNRRDWGVEWDAPLETGGLLVGDKVRLELEISAVQATPDGG
jgi:polyisoprenoid-binding protein YceI